MTTLNGQQNGSVEQDKIASALLQRAGINSVRHSLVQILEEIRRQVASEEPYILNGLGNVLEIHCKPDAETTRQYIAAAIDEISSQEDRKLLKLLLL